MIQRHEVIQPSHMDQHARPTCHLRRNAHKKLQARVRGQCLPHRFATCVADVVVEQTAQTSSLVITDQPAIKHTTHIPQPTTRTQDIASSSSWPVRFPSPRHLPRRCCCCPDCTNTRPRHHGSTYDHAHNTHPTANNTHSSSCKLEFVASAFPIASPPASPMLLLIRLHIHHPSL